MERAISCRRVLAILFVAAATSVGVTGAPKATRINRAIDLLAQGQPVYYTGSHEGTDGNFEQGVKDAQTWADYISYDMEHAPFDVKGLADYMRGLAKGGPTKSGHRTPAVIVNVPVNGTDEASVRANAWMFQQVLATGVHGVLLCHADDPGAARAFVDAVRFPSHGGRRGVHGNSTAAQIWGVSPDEYARRADVWPLNPDGELLAIMQIESAAGIQHREEIMSVPGVGGVLIGPYDLSRSLGEKSFDAPKVEEGVQTVLKTCLLKKMPCAYPVVAETAAAGREQLARRQMEGFRIVTVNVNRR